MFARFYFLSDDELLSVLGNADSSVGKQHLHKCFESVQCIQFDAGKSHFVSMKSREGEILDFINAVPMNGNVELRMASVENEMKSSLWAITKNIIFRFVFQERTKWIASNLTLRMASICGTLVWWTWEVKDGLTKLASGDKDALKEIEAKWTNQISDMVSMI